MEKLALSINGISFSGGAIPNGGISSSNIISVIITYLYIAVVILALLFIIWGGISWITSEGDKQKLAQARQKILFALIGLIVAFLAFFIVKTIGTIFGVTLI
jgi:FtsH-binding integral membrane protein